MTDEWKAAVAGQLSDALNDGFWANMPRKSRRKPDCKRLAQLADAMESAKKSTHDAVGAIARTGMIWFGRPTLERQIAEAFAKKIPIPGEESIDGVVHELRMSEYGYVLALVAIFCENVHASAH